MNRPWIAGAAALLLAAPGAQAAGVGQGDIEAGISVSLTSTEIETESLGTIDSDSGNVELSGGYFYTDNLEAKLGLSMTITTDATYGELKPGADYLFGTGGKTEATYVPFVGGSFALGIADSESDAIEVHGGVKYFFRERTSVEAKLGYLSPTDSEYSATTELSVGLNVYF